MGQWRGNIWQNFTGREARLTWFDRAVMWARADAKREWRKIESHLFPSALRTLLSRSQYSELNYPRCACHGGTLYTLSNGLVIFAETLSQWGL